MEEPYTKAELHKLHILYCVEVTFTVFYALIIAAGFFNIYKFLIVQERYKTQILLVLFYITAQISCIARLVSYWQFSKIYDTQQETPDLKRDLNKFMTETELATNMMLISTPMKIMCGIVQLTELVELKKKIQVIQLKNSLDSYYNKARPTLYKLMFAGLSIPFLTMVGYLIYSCLMFKKLQQFTSFKLFSSVLYQIQYQYKFFGYFTGAQFIAISLIMIVIFTIIFSMIRRDKALNQAFQKEKICLNMLFLSIIFGYFLRGIYQLGFSYFFQIISDTQNNDFKMLFQQAIIFDTVYPIFDLPNIVFVYIAHYVNFKEKTVKQVTEPIEDQMSAVISQSSINSDSDEISASETEQSSHQIQSQYNQSNSRVLSLQNLLDLENDDVFNHIVQSYRRTEIVHFSTNSMAQAKIDFEKAETAPLQQSLLASTDQIPFDYEIKITESGARSFISEEVYLHSKEQHSNL